MQTDEAPLLSPAHNGAGLGLCIAAVFLSGEMAGSGVLALPHALSNTGWSGLLLLVMFAINGAYIGFRLGTCWEMIAEHYEDFRTHELVRDPYPLIAERTGRVFGQGWGLALRWVTTACIVLTLWGGACVFIILISNFLANLVPLTAMGSCQWLLVVGGVMIPVTWLGSPKDFWPIAIGALVTTSSACILIIAQIVMDSADQDSLSNCTVISRATSLAFISGPEFDPPTFKGFMQAFGTIMFAFGGASTFPTIQADMRNKSHFKWAALIALMVLGVIYTPTSAVGFFLLGNCVQDNIVDNLSAGPIKIVVQSVLLVHLLTAFPIVMNPPNLFFENAIGIPKEFGWQRCVFRTLTLIVLVFVAGSIPSFGLILDLVGASTVTLLTFVFPPLFYMILSKTSQRG
eukprot:TCALIF_08321-PA protein Name:"Similar to AVT1 Vacuolar amino acid transporter 1 (Saccharomyces cerevisiae (strain ATCC 204508 / S288c))" AED:0.26 eAED:0.26 QI:61/1/0.6/1/0.75/0.8/5/0/401